MGIRLMLSLGPDLKLLTPAEHLLERQARDLIAAARRHGESGPLTLHFRLSDAFATELGAGRELLCMVDPKS